jgi:hypothetical protein
MGIQDSLILGITSDEMDSNLDQDEINEISLYLYDQEELLRKVKERMSKYMLEFYIEKIPAEDIEFWSIMLQEIIQVYSLNSLKPYMAEVFRTPELGKNIKDLLWFVKTDLITNTVENITIDTTREKLVELLKSWKAPILLVYAINMNDGGSLDSFKKAIVQESKMDYPDE